MSSHRILSYSLAINEALHQTMAADPAVFLIGQGVKSPWYVGNTAQGLRERFGDERVIDTPVSENAMTGAAVGAALAGMRPVVVHPRMDFMFYAFDPIINEAANWYYMSGGSLPVPVVFWGILNRGGEQAAQHSQALHGMFAQAPGLKVVMPATPYDAKGLMVAAIRESNPVVFIDDRWLYRLEEPVPEEIYTVEIGRARIVREGTDVTVAASSFMVQEALQASELLAEAGIAAEIIDLRTIKPLDGETLLASVKKTGRLVVADGGWRSFGVAAEISALAAERAFGALRAPVARVTLPDCPAPASTALENAYYRNSTDIIQAVRSIL
ncbi:MAG TPA: pyruvate dehydrogenase complex E1 component subunit beta [Syntrophales bacterium]|nr:pyruvate dehydrogenase complex E1 component subunit beta [Syntrophales bacterium]HOD97305.1 pyruvate dehydrogenase complex E1 component subunit beta [Syntrophales bacterium]HOH72049.1 pyruvate dehydrogenase complex E1 component subunit beta [Syntrophales bacterium]HPX80300.1 pyruvate dehydrogenase complex E1 component subunit beta [Syntrophales bacterium]HQB12844.1 pyruvate dehydrogenase complex E1 component subunit beta [Syntrophales bacterium]